MKIKVVDSLMGSGKSTWAFKYMYENKEKRFIYITPYLDEIERLVGSGTEDCPYTKWHQERRFREPKHFGKGKLDSLHYLLVNDYSIATTHSLFRMSTPETAELISAGGYTLILDESLDVVNIFNMHLKDYNMLINNSLMKVDGDGNINWLDNKYDGKFLELKKLCQNGSVYVAKKTSNVQLLVWNLNINSFSSFKEVFIMTYIFEASYIKYYFDMHKIEHEKYCIENFELVKHINKKPYDKTQYKKLLKIYEGSLNNIGDKKSALSLNWFKKNDDLCKKLKNNIYNYFQNITKGKSEDIIWTTFKFAQRYLKGKGYTTSFVACNAKATNAYGDKNVVAYCCNRYISPDYIDYFRKRGVAVDEELYALGEMIQFIWRSAIRNMQPVNIYIPSKRMRDLLIWWLNNDNI